MLVCPQAGEHKGYQEDYASDFYFSNWDRAVASLFQLSGARGPVGGWRGAAVEVEGDLLPEGLKWQLAMPTLSLSVWATDSGLGPSFPSFSWEYFVQRLGQA